MKTDFIILKDGSNVDRRLDRIPFFDQRSRSHRFTADNRTQISNTWDCPIFLDQGKEGACVGFGITHALIAESLSNISLDSSFAKKKIYWPAQKNDPWPGGSYPGGDPFYEGTTVLAGIKQAKKLGYITHYKYAMTLHDLIVGVGHDGPAVLGIKWFEGMYNTNKYGFIQPTGKQTGGHCICCTGVDVKRKLFILHNSWGKDWGSDGKCYVSFDDMQKLLNMQGEAAFLYGAHKEQVSKKKVSFWSLFTNLFR